VDWTEVEREGLALPVLANEATGHGTLIAIVDTGVRFDHPHLLLPQRGFGIARGASGTLSTSSGEEAALDLYGHGTCCAALVHLLAPRAALFAVRVTDERGTTDTARLARGIVLATAEGADIIAVALGTEVGDRAVLDAAVATATQRQAVVVAADPRHGRRVLPAQSLGAIGVGHLDGVDVGCLPEGAVVAEGRARPSPSPGARNFWGSSLSTARAAAALARLLEASQERGDALRRGFKKALSVL
jgi:membrane-anchored mycosin MYCP